LPSATSMCLQRLTGRSVDRGYGLEC